MQTAFHITALVSQLKRELIGGRIVSTEFYRKERAAFIFIKKDKTTVALALVFHPAGFGSFLAPASKIKLSTREKPWPIFKIEGTVVQAVEQLGFDRIFRIELKSGDTTWNLLFEAIGPNGNIWLLDDTGGRRATLRKRDFQAGELYEVSPVAGKLDPFDLTADSLRTRLKTMPDASPALLIEKTVLGFNKTLAREAVRRAGLDVASSDELEDDAVAQLVRTVQDIGSLFMTQEVGYLYRIAGGVEVYPFKLTTVDTSPEKFKSLSLAVMAMIDSRQTSGEQHNVEKSVTDAVKRMVKKLTRRLGNVENDLKDAADYRQYKKIGELLQISLGKLKKGMTEITLDDIYIEPHQPITVKLEPALSPTDNAKAYFKKHRKGREGLELLKRRREVSHSELALWERIQQELAENFELAQAKYEQELQSMAPGGGASKQTVSVRLPYREFRLSTGVRVFVGRDGSDNDRTTFEFARPYELWFHAQQCPGSHVVLKFPDKSFEPSKREIEETAGIAAFFSKAKKNSLVPIIYTQRRYVRKPRKAKPGLVTVEREKSVMVPPTKPNDER